MPEGSKVHKVYEALKKKGYSKEKSAKIAQAQTGEALKTGEPIKSESYENGRIKAIEEMKKKFLNSDFIESEHKRDKDGRFSKTNGISDSKKNNGNKTKEKDPIKSKEKKYETIDYEKAPQDKLKKADILWANKIGLDDSKSGEYSSFYTPVLQRAYDLGYNKGIDLRDAPIVEGIRYGAAPDSGISQNYAEGTSEYGLSLAQESGKKQIGSSVWFSGRKAYEYRGVKVGTGSDGETIILPLHVEKYD